MQRHLLGLNKFQKINFVTVITFAFTYLIWNALDHQFVCDDAYISFRYSENWAQGHGFVFNVGERVEGYTNFLWVYLLGLLRLLFNLPPPHTSIFISYTITLLMFGVVGLIAYRLPLSTVNKYVSFAAATLLFATNRNVAIWATGGLETRLFTTLIVLALLLISEAEQMESRQSWLWIASGVFGLAELTRPEGLLLFSVASASYTLILLGIYRVGWRAWWRRLTALVISFIVIVLAHYLWRYLFYGEWLPNTYYAKHVRSWPEAGWRYLLVAVIEGGLYLSVPLATFGAWISLRKRSIFPMIGMSLICVHSLYVVHIGGDHFEFRMLDFYWPILAVATASGAVQLRLSSKLKIFIVLITLVYSVAFQLAHDQAIAHHKSRRTARNLSVPLGESANHGGLRWLPGSQLLTGIYDPAQKYLIDRGSAVRWVEHKFFHTLMYHSYSPYKPYAHKIFNADDVTSFKWVGVMPYYASPLTVIDEHGLTDSLIARTPVKVSNQHRSMAHDRLPPPGYLEHRGVYFQIERAETQLLIRKNKWSYALRLKNRLWMNFKNVKDHDKLLKRFGSSQRSPTEFIGAFLSSTFRRNRIFYQGKMIREHTRIGNFDRSFGSWRIKEGSLKMRFDKSTRKPIGHIGRGYLDSYQRPGNDLEQWEVVSPHFEAKVDDYLSFLVGGGRRKAVGVQLVCEKSSSKIWRGNHSPRLRLVVVPLKEFAAQRCQVVVFDRSQDKWGHIIADHFWLGSPE